MIAYADIKNKKTCMCSNVEIVCSKKELDLMIKKLMDFQNKIELHIENNGQQGKGHLHFQDNINTWTNVLYDFFSEEYNNGQSPTLQLFPETYVE